MFLGILPGVLASEWKEKAAQLPTQAELEALIREEARNQAVEREEMRQREEDVRWYEEHKKACAAFLQEHGVNRSPMPPFIDVLLSLAITPGDFKDWEGNGYNETDRYWNTSLESAADFLADHSAFREVSVNIRWMRTKPALWVIDASRAFRHHDLKIMRVGETCFYLKERSFPFLED